MWYITGDTSVSLRLDWIFCWTGDREREREREGLEGCYVMCALDLMEREIGKPSIIVKTYLYFHTRTHSFMLKGMTNNFPKDYY